MKRLVHALFVINFLLSLQVFAQANSNSAKNLSQKDTFIQISNELKPLLDLFELGIGSQTILHEATHAAQSCPNGLLSPIGWTLPVNQSIKNEIQANLLRNYDINQYTIEKEAFYLQSQRNGVELLMEVIKKRC